MTTGTDEVLYVIGWLELSAGPLVLQVPDFRRPENFRRIGLVDEPSASQVQLAIREHPDVAVPLTIDRDGEMISTTLTPVMGCSGGTELPRIGSLDWKSTTIDVVAVYRLVIQRLAPIVVASTARKTATIPQKRTLSSRTN